MPDAQQLAQQILDSVGGSANIADVENCMTRLRVEVSSPASVDLPALQATDGVMAAIAAGSNLQIVLGPGLVDRVADGLEALRAAAPSVAAGGPGASSAAGASGSSPEELAARGASIKATARARSDGRTMRAIRKISAIFIPLIPALIACGLIAGINGILTNLEWVPGVTPFLGVLSSGFLSLLAVFVGMNAAKEFGGTPILGGAVGGIIVAAGVANVTVFGETLAPGQGGVLGAMAGGILAAYVERFMRRVTPDVIALIVVPTVTVLVAGSITLGILMSVAGVVSVAIGTAATWLLANGGAFAGFVLGGLFLPLVMTGMHQGLIPIHTTLIDQTGWTVLLPVLAMGGAGQIGACIALWVRFRSNASLVRTIRGALPAGFLGVGEPLIYGVTLPLGRPFITACIGGAFGGGVVGLFDQLGHSVGAIAIGASDLSLIPLLNGSSGYGWALLGYGSGLIVAYVVGFVATLLFGVSDSVRADLEAQSSTPSGDPAAPDAPLDVQVTPADSVGAAR
ncbi:PTS system IIB component (Glc family) /PTS system IIC component (Glc family) [Curtobacterium sp. JUb34]|uniref:PTS transporter subunit EIIC n=1 Tax=Curtobacterium sp. JUb34 TaxID=2485109 RepID=UPI000F49E0CB|nr:PTS transporter subunit EIIC [Curtobacterium sp. JUb34]ROR33821.1 PTS system IIB component (Glc family) /PTS system IIC component (Glc family) [Curtobacterium sp. JUb34]